MAHNDGTGEEGDDSREAQQFSNEIGDISCKENEAGLFDGVSIEGYVNFEEIAESESKDRSDGQTEESQYQKIEDHKQNDLYT